MNFVPSATLLNRGLVSQTFANNEGVAMTFPKLRLTVTSLILLGAATVCGDSPSTVQKSESSTGESRESNQNNNDDATADKNPTLEWITINTDGWELAIDERKMKAWTDKDGDTLALILYSRPEVDGNGLPKDFPELELGLERLRDYRRTVSLEHESGLVQADLKTFENNVMASVAISKTRMAPRGFEFSGACIIPRNDFSFWILVSASETGTTGIREAAVTKELIESGEVTLEMPADGKPGKITGFFQDPYDPEHNEGALYNLSDQEKYDDRFPRSPLTRVRTKLRNVIDSMVLSPEILESQPYRAPIAPTETKSRR